MMYSTWNSSGMTLQIILLVGKFHLSEVERDREHVCARCACRDAGTAVHTLRPEEPPDVHKLL